MTGRGSIPSSVSVFNNDAVQLLTKPAWPHELLAAIRTAIDRDRASQDGEGRTPEKMRVDSVADVGRMAGRVGIGPESSSGTRPEAGNDRSRVRGPQSRGMAPPPRR
jgi:DNA-binding response OmpR family regulator